MASLHVTATLTVGSKRAISTPVYKMIAQPRAQSPTKAEIRMLITQRPRVYVSPAVPGSAILRGLRPPADEPASNNRTLMLRLLAGETVAVAAH